MQDDTFHVSFPIEMIKAEERIVTGVATADNIDSSGDIIEFDASEKAFKAWRGNIREMHAPVAVGKAIDYEAIDLEIDGALHKGMRLSAFVSKGAQSTWEKVLDGTLAAFSVGGRILEKKIDDTLSKQLGRPIHRISKYELGEVSLVDNPANPAAVVELVKSNAAGELCYVLGTDEDTTENDSESNISLQKDTDYDTVLLVEDKLFNESAEVSGALSIQEKVSLLRRFVNWLHVDTEDEISVSDDIEKFEIEASPDSNQDSEGDVDMDIDILKDALGAVVDEKLSLFKEELKSDTQTYVDEKLDSVAKSVEVEEAEVVEAEVDSSVLDAAIAKFREELDGATATIQEQKDALSDASAKIEQLETAGAIKKSVESDEEMVEDETIAKTAGEPSFWSNLYLPQELIKAFGYEK